MRDVVCIISLYHAVSHEVSCLLLLPLVYLSSLGLNQSTVQTSDHITSEISRVPCDRLPTGNK